MNLRNRVAWTALFNKAADLVNGNANAAAATYYSYDILGNVDTLVQDYGSTLFPDISNPMNANGNRYKKLVYNYDLVSGKVNQVTYQHGFPDAFYHSYLYDAENRITNVQSSVDSINWDNDAFYSYYAHGPLARTVLGQQQVQGVNYVYTLQGWLKAINPAPYTGSGFTLSPDSAGNVVAGSAYNLLLNYYNGDFAPISGVAGPDSAVSTVLGTIDYRPLYNGNISSMGVNVKKVGAPLLYNYQYDQLNRLVGMDAWKRTSSAWSAITKVPDFQERVSYDPNGNILGYRRNGNNTFAGQPIGMDSLNYFYTAGTNKLDHVSDSVPASNYTTDIDGQAAGNYQYDSIGQLVSDAASGISGITWTVYGKIASITKGGDTTILYTYDPGGNRISKSVVHGGDTLTTWYVRDATGNVMSVYTYGDPAVSGKDLTQTELHIYGSSRLGILKTNNNVEHLPVPGIDTMSLLGTWDTVTFTRGNKLFELTNHLGNVLATVSDKRFGVSTDDSTVGYFVPEIVSAQDYYPFGMMQPGRSYMQANVGSYRYGFNGQEKSDEIKGPGNSYTAEFWEYDPRIGRRWNLDPRPMTGLSQYSAFNNSPIWFNDPLGDTLSNPQLVDAIRTAYSVVQTHLETKTFNIGVDYSAEVNKAVLAYGEMNKLNFGDLAAFQQQALDYYKGFKEVAGSYGGGTTMSEYGSKILSLVNPNNETTVIRTTQALVNSRNGQYGTILQQSMRITPVLLDAPLRVEVGPGPRGPMINSNMQQAIVNAGKPVLRQAYEAEVTQLKSMVEAMRGNGATAEEIARTVSAQRRALGVKYKDLTPPDLRETMYNRNIKRYGDPLGPTVDWLRAKGKSWDEIIESATRPGGQDINFNK